MSASGDSKVTMRNGRAWPGGPRRGLAGRGMARHGSEGGTVLRDGLRVTQRRERKDRTEVYQTALRAGIKGHVPWADVPPCTCEKQFTTWVELFAHLMEEGET